MTDTNKILSRAGMAFSVVLCLCVGYVLATDKNCITDRQETQTGPYTETTVYTYPNGGTIMVIHYCDVSCETGPCPNNQTCQVKQVREQGKNVGNATVEVTYYTCLCS